MNQNPTLSEISTCAECMALLDDSRSQVLHQGRLVDRCLRCGRHGLCVANPMGPHETIRWPEDPEYDLGHVEPPGPLPVGCRVGYCARCLQPVLEQGDGFIDLTWETVGLQWAQARGLPIDKLGAGERRVEIVQYRTVQGTQQLGHLRLRFVDGPGEFWVAQRIPPTDWDGPIMGLFRALGMGEGDTVDLDRLLGKEVIVTLRKLSDGRTVPTTWRLP